jgi:hypothetical protein
VTLGGSVGNGTQARWAAARDARGRRGSGRWTGLLLVVALCAAVGVGVRPAAAVTCASTDPIALRYCQLGGTASFLGAAKTATYAVAGGRARDFVGGTIYWSAGTGARYVRGAILIKYRALGGPASFLRFPTTDERVVPDRTGWYSHFGGGSIYSSSASGTHEIHGAIRDKWAALGWERSVVGWPTTDEQVGGDGRARFTHFSRGGSIFWSAATSAHEVHGAIRTKWAALGWEKGVLGLPTTDEVAVVGGRQSSFVHGSVAWTSATGATSARPDSHEYWLTEPLTSAAAFQRAFDRFHTSSWAGADGGMDVTLPDGRQALMFGDTLRGVPTTTGGFAGTPALVSNSLVTVDNLRLRSVPGPTAGSAWIPDDASGSAYWPVGAVSVGQRLWVLCSHVDRGAGSFGFAMRDVRLAAFDVPAGGDPVFRGTFAVPGAGAFAADGSQAGVAWNGAITSSGGYVYVYGTRPRPFGAPLGADMFVARVAAAALATPSSWTYWDGTAWSADQGAAASLLDPAGYGVPPSFDVSPLPGGGWVADGKANGIFSEGISTWTAPAPQGPWRQQADVLPHFPGKLVASEFTYGGYRLPYPLGSGRGLLVYSRNASWEAVLADTGLYMPQFVEVDPPLVGG